MPPFLNINFGGSYSSGGFLICVEARGRWRFIDSVNLILPILLMSAAKFNREGLTRNYQKQVFIIKLKLFYIYF
jgi:hypothetical protein